MARLIFIAVLLTFLSVQLVSSQDRPSQECLEATSAIATSTRCSGDIDDVDRSVACNGECRSLAEAFFNACADQVSIIAISRL